MWLNLIFRLKKNNETNFKLFIEKDTKFFLNKLLPFHSQIFEFFVVLRAASLTALVFINFGDDRVANALKVFQVGFKVLLVSILVAAQPVLGFSQGIADLFLVIFIQLVGKLVFVINSVAHLVDVVLKLVLGINFIFQHLIGLSKFLCILNHALNFFLCQSAFVVGD